MNDALSTLLSPFKRGVLDPPVADERAILFGASAGLRLPSDFAADFQILQDFRPDYLALEKAGFHVVSQVEGNDFDAAFVLLGRHRRENELRLSEALRRVRPGGLIAAAGTKNDGAPSFRKRVAELLPIEDHLSKHHGVVFWLRRPEVTLDFLGSTAGKGRKTPEGFETAVGGFSEGAVDSGSRLLADNLPPDITGSVADFAAGWGYLSLRAAERFPVDELDLYEAHLPSLEAAERNFAARAPVISCRFFWYDLLSERVEARYDTILMNPPFHRSRAAEPDIGRAMIAVAAKALKPGGRLFLVANRPLPYEEAMGVCFARHGEICREATYKVLWGRR